MKTRQGFVSNSSSSSFIVAFHKKLEDYTDEELKLSLLGTDGSVVREHYGDRLLNTDELIEEVRNSAEEISIDKDGSFLSKKRSDRSYFGADYWWEASEQAKRIGFSFEVDSRAFYAEVDRIAKELSKVAMKEFLEEVKEIDENPVYYYFSFSDETTIGSHLEHGDIFRSYPHKVENNH